MTLSVRLDERTKASLDIAAERAGISTSEFVRQCIESRLEEEPPVNLAWELGKDLFGKYASGRSDVSANKKKYLEEIFDEKRRNR